MTGYPYQSYRRQMSPALIAAISESAKPIYEKLLDDARASSHSGHQEMAVVFAQAAAELCTEATLQILCDARGASFLAEPLRNLFQTPDLANNRLREFAHN